MLTSRKVHRLSTELNYRFRTDKVGGGKEKLKIVCTCVGLRSFYIKHEPHALRRECDELTRTDILCSATLRLVLPGSNVDVQICSSIDIPENTK